MADAVKTCKKCGAAKDAAEFYEARAVCKACVTASVREYSAANKDKRREYLAANSQRVKAQFKEWSIVNAEHRKEYRVATAEREKNRRVAGAEQKRQYDKDRYTENTEEIKERVNLYRIGHIEQIKQYLVVKREHISERGKRYLARNRAAITAYKRAFYAANTKRLAEDRRAWAAKNPGKARAQGRSRRARQRQSEGTLSHAEWIAIVKRFGGRCVCCGESHGLDGKGLAADHIYMIGPLGSTTKENTQPLCRSCNSKKSNRHSTDYRKTPFTGGGQQRLFG